MESSCLRESTPASSQRESLSCLNVVFVDSLLSLLPIPFYFLEVEFLSGMVIITDLLAGANIDVSSGFGLTYLD